MARLLHGTVGFGATDMMRRVIGMAHVQDLESIPDVETRTRAERLALLVAQSWLMNRHDVRSIDEMVAVLHSAASDAD